MGERKLALRLLLVSLMVTILETHINAAPLKPSLRKRNMTAAPEASEPSLSVEEAAILDIAAAQDAGEFVLMRRYGKRWGTDHAMVKRLEARGFMRFKSDGRAPQTRDYLRTSSITESGRVAARPAAQGVTP
jgi:hypothetical protein